MKESLTSTDVALLARGHWAKYFEWRFLPKMRRRLIAALVFLGAFVIAELVTTAQNRAVADYTPTAGGAALSAALLLLFLGALLWAVYIYGGAKSEFVDATVSRWESGDKELPSADTVRKFITENGLGR